MNSPAEIPYLNFIHLDRNQQTAIYLQLAQQLINAIQRGYLPAGAKLPGSRTLGELLHVHRLTVVKTYEELETRGWVETRPNKGTFVLTDNKTHSAHQHYPTPISLAKYPDKAGFQFAKSHILDNPFEYSPHLLQFNDGVADIRLNQFDQLSHLYSASMRRKSTLRKWDKYTPEGSTYFREQLANYLNYSRGLHISKDNLLITRSTEMSLYIISKLLLLHDDTVLVGELSNFTANMIFKDAGANIETIPVDHDGINIEALKSKLREKKIRIIYVTPHHHYPTTVALSPERRIELLKLAHEFGFIILEDDYDYDFQYEKGTAMPMASADINGMVIYIGTFGKSLAPSFRAGFVVAPHNLMEELQKYIGLIDRQGDVFLEQVLGEMIEEGNIHRFLKKSLKIYKERRDHLCNILDNEFADTISYQKPSGGLAIWLAWKRPLSLLHLSANCNNDGLFIPKNILYQNRSTTAIRLGFGHLSTEEMNKSMEILKFNYDLSTNRNF